MKVNIRLLSVLLAILLLSSPLSHAETALLNSDQSIHDFAITHHAFISGKEAADLVWQKIATEYSDQFVPIDIKYSERLLIVYVETEGLAAELQTAYEAGYDEHYAPWAEYKANLLNAYNTIADMLAEHGRSDISFEMWLCNDGSRAGKRSPFTQSLAYITSRDWVFDEALFRYEDTAQDIRNLPTDIQSIYAYFKESLETLGFDYVSLFYNETDKIFIIEVAIKGVGENLYSAKQAGYDEKYVPWAELKAYLEKVYTAMLMSLQEIGRDDISIIFELVNDEVHIRGYFDRLTFDPLFSITNVVVKTGNVVCDAMD